MADEQQKSTTGEARAEGATTATTTDTTTVTTTPAPPKDDLVTTRHALKVGRRTLRYTATAGRVVLREEVFEDGVFKGHQSKAEMGITAHVLDAPAGSQSIQRPRSASSCCRTQVRAPATPSPFCPWPVGQSHV